jgi:hypothetical protein
MNVDEILKALNTNGVDYLLIGGMNFLIHHLPELTFDVDIWVDDTPDNLGKLNRALKALEAEWGRTVAHWAPIPEHSGWLENQLVFCLTTAHGALDVYLDVKGLENQYQHCKQRAISSKTASGVQFLGLSDEDMLASQTALPTGQRKQKRMEVLREAIRNRPKV